MRGVSSIVVGLLLSLAVAGFLSAVVLWARQRAESVNYTASVYPTVAAYGLPGRTVVVNYGPRGVSASLLTEDGRVCGTVVLEPRSAAVSSCAARWVVVGGRLVGVVRVA
ncbi:MAG: hypothetical protein QXE66_03745 [Desulfurococcaceae archaeon]